MSIGSRVKELREKLGFTKRALAGRSGLSSNAIYLIEVGRRSPNAETLIRLADALGVEVGDLFPKEQPPLFGEEGLPEGRHSRPEDLAEQRLWLMPLLTAATEANERAAVRGVSPAMAEVSAKRSDDLFVVGWRLFVDSNPDALDSAEVGLRDFEVSLYRLVESTVGLVEAAKERANAAERARLEKVKANIQGHAA